MLSIKKIVKINLLISLVVLSSCNSKFKLQYETDEHGVSIQKDSIIIKLEVINESIIHVNKMKLGDEPTSIPDYVTVLDPQEVTWEVIDGEVLTVSTDSLNVFVNVDGVIEYETKGGLSIVSETNELTFINPKGSKHTVSQAFVAGDEGLYGLGQFQSGIMNWKNVPIRLQQYNQEIAIPFLVSTKGYGIYWHNYSLTDFNQPENEIKFSSTDATLTEKINKNEGVNGEKEDVASHIKKSKTENDNIRETTFTPSKTGEYTFLALSDNSGRMRGSINLSIDGDDVINYETIWIPRRYSGKKHLVAGKTYKVVFKNIGAKIPGRIFYNEPDFSKTVFSSTAGNAIDYYLIHGNTPVEVVTGYQNLTGKAPMFPKSAYGFWQCRERYHNQEELLENAREMRARNIPVDNIVQDWFYWPDGTKGPEWDRAKYPDPKAMADEVRSLNLKLMVSVWPEVKHKSLEKKYNLTKIEGSNKLDFYDEGVQERYYRMLSDSMFHNGVSHIWLDGSESAGSPKSDIQTAVGPNDEVYNAYSLLVTKSMYEGRRKEFPTERVFNLTRSAYAGQQRYGVTSWSGDVQSTWEQLAEQIPAGLNFTMAGIPYWTHDIGGFFRDAKSINPIFDNQYTNPEFIELLTRWFQFGTFSPIFRIHGYKSETEIWRYNQEFEDIARKFIDIRYQLMPYIYSEAWKVTTDGKLLMAPLSYQYPNDKNTWNIKDQFLFGESIMVGIVTEYKKRSKEMYLPEGTWYNFWNDEKFEGNQNVIVDAPLDETPVFVKSGTILPIGPKVQHANVRTKKPSFIVVYPGKDAEYTLYLDDGESYNYEQGTYSEIKFSYSEETKKLTVKTGDGVYYNFNDNPMEFIFQMVGERSKEQEFFYGDDLTIQF
ncbi:DUF5110 domain-containing protein [Seonamhaeicola sp. MEBiC1930]|uniref:TIM-barrel domain-containing protein n=1 Tax=Seonamhaeicola sp. MEBiC01930 TaxID=2976768 RepID=UPI0032538F10